MKFKLLFVEKAKLPSSDFPILHCYDNVALKELGAILCAA